MRNKKIANEYILYENFAELVITRSNGEKIHSQIDLDKVDFIKQKHWNYTTAGYIRSCKSDGYILLHRYLKNAQKEDIIDHIDGNPLNNRNINLRSCNLKENGRNSRNRPKPNKIIGVRKDPRCKSSYRAQIYFSSNQHIEKTFQNEEYAILRRLTWELMYFGEFAPQMELINTKYKYLLNYFKVKDTMVFTNDMETILSIGKHLEVDPHCPCIVAKNDNTICPCLPCRSKQHCHCGMFVPIGSQEDYFQVKYGTK